MKEQDWLQSNDPSELLERLTTKVSERKLRLFICACCRQMWDLFLDERSRHAIETLEKYADRKATRKDLDTARLSAEPALLVEAIGRRRGIYAAQIAYRVAYPTDTKARAVMLHSLVGRALAFEKLKESAASNLTRRQQLKVMETVGQQESSRMAILLRDIVGNPFHPALINDFWLHWNDGTVPKIAQAIYDSRDFSLMPILADALEDAGCDNADILDHCRQPGEHVRGCWVVDRLLGKS